MLSVFIAEPFRNSVTILQTQILVNLFLVLSVSFICNTTLLNTALKGGVSRVQFHTTALRTLKFDCDSSPFHSVCIIPLFEPAVNRFLKFFGSFLAQKVLFFNNIA